MSTADEQARLCWKECAAICEFLSEHDGDLSKETRELLAGRIARAVKAVEGLCSPPEPF